jgi:hypothetical protein
MHKTKSVNLRLNAAGGHSHREDRRLLTGLKLFPMRIRKPNAQAATAQETQG